jgi:PAS domain S-box-containing protein
MKNKKIKLFLVDDDVFFLKLLEIEFLQHTDFSIESFTTGELCIKNLSHKPDIIILDYHLNSIDEKAMNGIEALEAIKAFNLNIPIVILSSQDAIDVAVKCVRHGAFDYVVKNNTAFLRLRIIIAAIFHKKEMEQKVTEQIAQLEIINKDISDYKFALDVSSIVAITDKKGIIIHVNDNFCKISKYSKDELIGKEHRFLNPIYHSKEFISNITETIINGKIWKGEINNVAKDGTTYWTSTTIVPFLDENGNPYKYLSIRFDITQLKQFTEELKISEGNYKDLFENSIVSIFTIDIETLKIIEINGVGAKLFGYKSKNDFLKIFDASKHYLNFRQKEKYLKILKEKGELRNKLVELKKLDGTFFWANIFMKLNHEKNIAQAVIIDITQQMYYHRELETKVKERTIELTKSLEREKELNEMKTRFVTNASHEFRTPLAGILTSAYLIEKYSETEQQEKRAAHIDRISSSVKDLTNILNLFLSLSDYEKGVVEVESVLFNLPEFIETTVEEMEGVLSEKFQQIKFSHHGDTAIELSKKILKKILLNLLSNASKYSPEKKEIHVTSSIVNNKVSIIIQDYGIGIPIEDQNRLFSEFFRASNSENIQGTGLGLSIVKKYVELLDGKISFISKLNEGTTFEIEFSKLKS